MHLDKPINENSSHFLIYIFLSLHISWDCDIISFCSKQKLKNITSIFTTTLWVTSIGNINWIDLSFVKCILNLLEFLYSSTLWIDSLVTFWSLRVINAIICINRGLCSSLTNRKLLSYMRWIIISSNLLLCTLILSTKWHISTSGIICGGSILTQTSNCLSFHESVLTSLWGIYVQIVNHALYIFNILRRVIWYTLF